MCKHWLKADDTEMTLDGALSTIGFNLTGSTIDSVNRHCGVGQL